MKLKKEKTGARPRRMDKKAGESWLILEMKYKWKRIKYGFRQQSAKSKRVI